MIYIRCTFPEEKTLLAFLLNEPMSPRIAEKMYLLSFFLSFWNHCDDNDDLSRATELLPNPPPPMKANKQHAVITPLIKCLLSSN